MSAYIEERNGSFALQSWTLIMRTSVAVVGGQGAQPREQIGKGSTKGWLGEWERRIEDDEDGKLACGFNVGCTR